MVHIYNNNYYDTIVLKNTWNLCMRLSYVCFDKNMI